MARVKKKIVVFDEDEQRGKDWGRKLQKVSGLRNLFTLEVAALAEFKQGIEILEQRRQSARDKSATRPNGSPATIFDEADVLVLDYDLFNPQQAISTTGEWVAYLARCYSPCGIIVGVNQFVRGGKSSFDLTLREHPESFADMNIGDADLDNEGLWIQPKDGFRGFRAWYWPLLSNAVNAFRQRSAALVGNLKEPILKYLNLEMVADLLPRASVEFVERGSNGLSTVTFSDFVQNSGNGLRLKDSPMDDESVARIAAARISTWLESMVLPSQDILVDAPHLVARYSSLLHGDRNSIDTWNAVVSLILPKAGRQLKGMHSNKIEALRFKHDAWVSRPVWYWNQVSEYTEIDEVRDPFNIVNALDVVFCEDISRFMPHKFARDFSADVPGPFDRRFVVSQDAKLLKSERDSLAKVEYEPKVRFVL